MGLKLECSPFEEPANATRAADSHTTARGVRRTAPRVIALLVMERTRKRLMAKAAAGPGVGIGLAEQPAAEHCRVGSICNEKSVSSLGRIEASGHGVGRCFAPPALGRWKWRSCGASCGVKQGAADVAARAH
jgi:hypothetical protein